MCYEVSSYLRQQESKLESSQVEEKVNDLKQKIKEGRDKCVTKSRFAMNKVKTFEKKHIKKLENSIKQTKT